MPDRPERCLRIHGFLSGARGPSNCLSFRRRDRLRRVLRDARQDPRLRRVFRRLRLRRPQILHLLVPRLVAAAAAS